MAMFGGVRSVVVFGPQLHVIVKYNHSSGQNKHHILI